MPERVSTFDRIASEYDETIPPHVTRHYLERRVAFARSLWPGGGHLLDLGCGTGALGEALRAAGFRVTGVDLSAGMLRQARGRGVHAVCASAGALPWRDATFDGVVSVAVLHHLATPARVAAGIAEIVRVTREGGRVLLWDHNPLNPYWPIFMRRLPQDDGSERLIGRRELRACAARAGASVERIEGRGWMPDFMPPALMPLARASERLLEAIPGSGWLAAHNVAVLRKTP